MGEGGDVGGEKMFQNGVAETAGAAGDQQRLAVENGLSHKGYLQTMHQRAHFYFISLFILP